MMACDVETRAETVVVAGLRTPTRLWQALEAVPYRDVFGQIGRQDVTLAIGYALDKRCIVVVGCQRQCEFEITDVANVLEPVLATVFRPGIFAHQSHDEFFLTAHRVIGDVVEPVSHILAVDPPCFVHHFDYFIIHYRCCCLAF